MKKISISMIVAFLITYGGGVAKADDTTTSTISVSGTSISTGTVYGSTTAIDNTLNTVWENNASVITSSFTVTAGTFYDAVNGELLYGGSAELRRLSNKKDWFKYVGIDFTLLTTGQSGSNGLPAIGFTIHGSEIVTDKLPEVADVAKTVNGSSFILNALTFGGWATRDFYNGIWRAGVSAGATFKF